MMAEETLYTIGQLAEVAGITPRTIRYYTAEGLLPRPDARGQYALYSEEHLLRLRLIGRLKQAYLPLGEIKARIEHLDGEQIRLLLEEYRDQPAPPASAADYLAEVRALQQAPQTRRQFAEHAEPYGVERPALSLRQPPSQAVPAAQPPAAPIYGFAAPMAVPAHAPRPAEQPQPSLEGPPTEAPQQGGLLRKLIPPRRPPDTGKAARAGDAPLQTATTETEQHWRRVSLAPGVELHPREPVATAPRWPIDRLIALGRSLFARS